MKTNDPHLKQVMRLTGCQYFPQHAEGARELVNALKKHAPDADHARRVIDAALEANDNCPTVHGLIELCGQVPVVVALPGGCAGCSGTGWRSVTKGGYECSERCGCARGQALAAMGQGRAA